MHIMHALRERFLFVLQEFIIPVSTLSQIAFYAPVCVILNAVSSLYSLALLVARTVPLFNSVKQVTKYDIVY